MLICETGVISEQLCYLWNVFHGSQGNTRANAMDNELCSAIGWQMITSGMIGLIVLLVTIVEFLSLVNFEMLLMLEFRPTKKVNLRNDTVMVVKDLNLVAKFLLNGLDPMSMNNPWWHYGSCVATWDKRELDGLMVFSSRWESLSLVLWSSVRVTSDASSRTDASFEDALPSSDGWPIRFTMVVVRHVRNVRELLVEKFSIPTKLLEWKLYSYSREIDLCCIEVAASSSKHRSRNTAKDFAKSLNFVSCVKSQDLHVAILSNAVIGETPTKDWSWLSKCNTASVDTTFRLKLVLEDIEPAAGRHV